MKPQIQKEKIKKNKTNPNALTSVLKTLEKVKETQKQKQIAEIEKKKKEVTDKKKRQDELESMKNFFEFVIVTATVFLFSLLPSASGSLTFIVFNCFAKVEAIIKKINKRNTTSVIEDMLNSGLILFLPLRFI